MTVHQEKSQPMAVLATTETATIFVQSPPFPNFTKLLVATTTTTKIRQQMLIRNKVLERRVLDLCQNCNLRHLSPGIRNRFSIPHDLSGRLSISGTLDLLLLHMSISGTLGLLLSILLRLPWIMALPVATVEMNYNSTMNMRGRKRAQE